VLKNKIASRELLEREKNKIMIRERSYKKKLVGTKIYLIFTFTTTREVSE
jgi:hypothetical protein